MPKCTLTRRVSFSAAHRYRRPEWDDAKNFSVFGACSWPNYHGHSYTCDVTVKGDIDPVTGFIVDLGILDEILKIEVREKFDHRNINTDIPEFADGKMIPSGENLAVYIFERVQSKLSEAGSKASVCSVTIAEDSTLSSTYVGD